MKIVGYTVGSPAPRPDWNENNPKKATYILNKPDIEKLEKDVNDFGAAAKSALDKATAAALALPIVTDTANNALPKAGGTMSGNINMSGKQVTNLPIPLLDGDAANKAYVDSVSGTAGTRFSVTLPASGWSQDATGKWFQRVDHDDVRYTDQPHWEAVYSGTKEQCIAQQEAFSLVDDLETNTQNMVFWCFRDKPKLDLTVQLEILRPGSGGGGGGGGATTEQVEAAVERALAAARDSGEFEGAGVSSISIKEV